MFRIRRSSSALAALSSAVLMTACNAGNTGPSVGTPPGTPQQSQARAAQSLGPLSDGSGYVYVVNFGSGGPSYSNISAYSIDTSGALTQVPGSPFAAGNDPVGVAIDPNGKLA